jgi:regulator of cell morphogenesis and NO signaling
MYEIDTNITQTSRLANLVIEFPRLLNALEYFDIPLGLGDKTIAETAAQYGIAANALEAVIQTYCRETPSKLSTKEEISDLLKFLKNSHNSFKLVKIPELKRQIEHFSTEIPSEQGKILVRFFDGYISEVDAHFRYEDEKVFPYIDATLCNKTARGFRIREFERNHTDIEQKLTDLKQLLIKYIATPRISQCHKQILLMLNSLAEDLIYHTKIEDDILVPFVKTLERKSLV